MDLYNDLEEICERLSKELKKANEKLNGRELSGADAAYMDQLLHSLKSVKTVMAMMDSESYDDGRSYDGRSYEGRSYEGRSGRSGRSGRRSRDSRGRYSGDYSGMRYSGEYSGRRGYSRDDEMISELRELMEDAPDEQTRNDLQRMISRMEMM